jgi:hypothetical protein
MSAAAARTLAAFMARYDRPVAALARAALVRLRRQLPGATELVYDNYNALVIGFGAGERASDAIVSLALYPRWVTLFFLQGAGLPDPGRRLSGTGSRVRSVRLRAAADVDSPDLVALLRAALARAKTPIDPDARRRLVIRSVSARQRPRRPPARTSARASRS